MAESLSSIRARIRQWLNVQSTVRLPDSVINDALNMAQDEMLGGADYRFGEQTLSMAFVNGTSQYSPTGPGVTVDRIIGISYVSPSSQGLVQLGEISYEAYLAKYVDPAATTATGGEPIEWAPFGQSGGDIQIFAGPTPNADIAGVSVQAYVTFDPLALDGDTNELVNTQWQAIFFRALYYCASFIEDDRKDGWMGDSVRLQLQLQIRHNRTRYAGMESPVMQEPH